MPTEKTDTTGFDNGHSSLPKEKDAIADSITVGEEIVNNNDTNDTYVIGDKSNSTAAQEHHGSDNKPDSSRVRNT